MQRSGPQASDARWFYGRSRFDLVDDGGNASVQIGLFDLHDIQAAFTRPVFANHLIQTWLPALPEVQATLTAGERVRIAEVGCGEGLAAITIARAHPIAEIDGFDLDEASISAARARCCGGRRQPGAVRGP